MIDSISGLTGFTKGDSKVLLDAIIKSIQKAVADGNTVFLKGLGTITTRDMAEKVARNPRTGEKVLVPARKKLVFRFAKVIKESVR